MLLGSAQNKVVLNFSRCNPKLFWKNSNSSLLLRLPIASAIPYHPLTNNRRSISFETINVVSKWKELEYSRRVSLVKHSLPIFKFALYTAWIPMLLPCFYMLAWWSSSRFLSVCMLYYGALLLSFQGGIRLGDNLRNLQAPDGQYTIYWSAVPPTLAFMSLLLPLGYSDLSLVLGHALVTYVDVTRSDYPEKYKGYRLIFTTIIIICLIFQMLMRRFVLTAELSARYTRDYSTGPYSLRPSHVIETVAMTSAENTVFRDQWCHQPEKNNGWKTLTNLAGVGYQGTAIEPRDEVIYDAIASQQQKPKNM